jgi:queuosine precursor transporter
MDAASVLHVNYGHPATADTATATLNFRKFSVTRSYHMTKEQKEGFVFLIGFIACIPAANWMIGNFGTTCVPQGPCLVPVAPGVMAPSGVLTIGLALVLRDLVQRRLGKSWAVLASATAFLLSELADFAVYTPLQERRFMTAVVASSIVGLVLDSVVFLWLAFGSLDFVWGQILGKAWMVLAAIPFIHWLRRRDFATGSASD